MKISLKVFHWLPRIICIAAILLVSVFAMDAFAPGLTAWQQLGAFILHLIPSFVLLLFLVIAWKRELAGGIIFTALGIIMTPFIYLHNRDVNHFSVAECINAVLLITFPFIAVGMLFIVSYFKKRKQLHA